MFDTIHIWLPSERSGKVDFNLFTQNLDRLEKIESDMGECKIRGKLRGNLNVLLTPNGISIKGSLAKYFLGNNLKTLSLEEIKKAIEKIGNDLSIPIFKAKLTRIDIGFNMSMDYEPRFYFNGLGERSRMYRSIVDPTSLYYKNGSKVLNFYDKNLEYMKKNRVSNGLKFEKNLLRYELRLIKWVSKNFQDKEILVSDLFDPRFCKTILRIWGQNYFSIKKNNIVGLDLRSISNQKDYLDFLLFRGIEAHREYIDFDIKFLKSIGAFKTKEYYSRLLSKIDKIGTNPQIISESVFNQELDSKILKILGQWKLSSSKDFNYNFN